MPEPGERPLALTMGDACGIGPEIVARLFEGGRPEARGAFVLGDLAVMRRAMTLIRTGWVRPSSWR